MPQISVATNLVGDLVTVYDRDSDRPGLSAVVTGVVRAVYLIGDVLHLWIEIAPDSVNYARSWVTGNPGDIICVSCCNGNGTPSVLRIHKAGA